MAKTSFFKPPAIEPKKSSEYSFIHVGGEPFHALAVALIDCFKNSSRVDEPSLKKILERFYSYFPKFISTQPYLTPNDRMVMLVSNSRKSEVVDCLAYVLRQMTIDEIFTHPLNYRAIFKDLSPDTSRDYFRQPTSVLPTIALAALTQVLALTITLSITEHGKELRRREIYSSNTTLNSQFEAVLQVQGDQYFPRVKSKSDYAFVGQLAVMPPKPVEQGDSKDISDVLEVLSVDDHRQKVSYDQSRKTILSMVRAGEVTKKLLIDLFVEFFPQYNALLLSKSQFFSEQRQLTQKPVVAEQSCGSEQEIGLLADTIARWISAGQINEDEFFERIESNAASTLTP